MKQQRAYITPESEILCFLTEDVIMTSGNSENGGGSTGGMKPGHGYGSKDPHSGPPGHTGIHPGGGGGGGNGGGKGDKGDKGNGKGPKK